MGGRPSMSSVWTCGRVESGLAGDSRTKYRVREPRSLGGPRVGHFRGAAALKTVVGWGQVARGSGRQAWPVVVMSKLYWRQMMFKKR